MSDTNPIAPLSKVMARLSEDGQTEGLNLHAFVVIPNLDPDGPHLIQSVFHLIPDWGKDEAKIEDPEFDAFIKAQEAHDAEERANQARESLKGLADDLKKPGGGLGLD